MSNADKWVQPTKFTGEYPSGWGGFTFLDWHQSNNVYHPGDDYNFGYGEQDLGQDVVATSAGQVLHTSKSSKGYGNIIIIKHILGYNLKRFVKETYGIETNELYSFYAHLKDVFVNVNDMVEMGQRIGTVGNTGTESPHLHFEIYAAIGELASQSWRFYPIGWSKEKIKEFWLPSYLFIESVKNIEAFETFLGKPKDYWLQVEKDREDLLKQLIQKDTVWAEKLQTIQKEIGTLGGEIAILTTKSGQAETSAKTALEDFTKKQEESNKVITDLKNQNSQLLAEQAKDMDVKVLVQILFEKIFHKGGEKKV